MRLAVFSLGNKLVEGVAIKQVSAKPIDVACMPRLEPRVDSMQTHPRRMVRILGNRRPKHLTAFEGRLLDTVEIRRKLKLVDIRNNLAFWRKPLYPAVGFENLIDRIEKSVASA